MNRKICEKKREEVRKTIIGIRKFDVFVFCAFRVRKRFIWNASVTDLIDWYLCKDNVFLGCHGNFRLMVIIDQKHESSYLERRKRESCTRFCHKQPQTS